MKTCKLTMGQATIEFLKKQYVERDGIEHQFFAGMFGIFGHGNVAGIGQALHQYSDSFQFFQTRNEQAMVHTAAAFAKMNNRLRTLACTASIGPGATNMVTAAAGATINRIPVLLLPGDIFSTRLVAPVLQQLESPGSQDISVNDCFRPISKYWDRINRPEQIITALPEAMRVLTSQSETGAATLAIPQDVQAEAFDYPIDFFEKRIYRIARPLADRKLLHRAIFSIRSSKKPLIIAGGGVIYAEATKQLADFARQTGIPVVGFLMIPSLSHIAKRKAGGVGRYRDHKDLRSAPQQGRERACVAGHGRDDRHPRRAPGPVAWPQRRPRRHRG